jgi:hypothetical protein
LNKNIIGLDFNHAHKLTFDELSWQLKFASANTTSIELLKQTILLEMTTTLVNGKYKVKANPKATYNRLRHA